MVYEESVVSSNSFDTVLSDTKAALAAEGFGILTEIDVQATLKEKAGTEIDRYVILGACNPPLASRALQIEPQIGVLLPCNVVVREHGGSVLVEAMDPGMMSNMVGKEALKPVADEARQRIGAALNRIAV